MYTLWGGTVGSAARRRSGSPELSSRDVFVKPLATPCEQMIIRLENIAAHRAGFCKIVKDEVFDRHY